MSLPPLPEQLAALAEDCGVATAYDGADGGRVDVPASTVRAVLGAMGVDAADEEAAAAALARRRRAAAHRLLPPVHVVRRGHPETRRLRAAGVEAAWVVREDGGRVEASVDGDRVTLPDELPLGYHRLHATAPRQRGRAALIVAPARCPVPAVADWGWLAQLYQLRSAASWGIGDLGDLRRLATASARELGAGFVVANPLHAVAPVHPVQPSPYFPSSRRFTTPLALRVEDVPEAAALPPADRERLDELARRGRALNAGDRLDHDAVLDVKLAALELVSRAPRSPRRQAALDAFRHRRGRALTDFATFCALAERHGLPWQDWPAELHDPHGPAVAAARERLADRVDFHVWLQWLADEQLADAQHDARDAGMAVGIVHDLAVGVDAGGADAWELQTELAGEVRVGAPPDDFNQQGQDWGQPPLRPDRLVHTGLRPFRDMLRHVLTHAGGIRIDHVLGLFRLYWIPAGAAATEGTYVRYPAEPMLAVLALEAARAGAVVVGEDLGTVEAGVRERLRDEGVLGSRVLYFEHDDEGPRRPGDYERWALASVTTHDLPTAAGFWHDEAVRLRTELDLHGPGRDAAAERARAAAEREALRRLLVAEGLVGDDADERELTVGLHALLARTPSMLVGASPADAVGDPRQPNLPGTVDAYPNWRLPLAEPTGAGLRTVSLEELLVHPRTRELAAALARDGRGTGDPDGDA